MLDFASVWVRQLAEWAAGHSFVLVNAGLLVVGGWIVAGWAAGRVRKLGKRFGRADAPHRPFVAELVRYAILSLVAVTALSMLGIPTAGLIALLLAFALAATLALQGSLCNVAAGAMVQALRPLKVGDTIETDGVTGTVAEVGIVSTSLRGDDGVFVSIPNNRLSNQVIRNFSRLATRRLEVSVSIGYDQEIDDVLALCRELVESNGRVLREPPPGIVVSALRETTVVITVRAWTSSEAHADVLFQLNREIKKALEAAEARLAPTAPRLTTPIAEPPAYISAAFRPRVRSRAIEP